MSRQSRKLIKSPYGWLLLIVIVLIVNVLASFVHTRADLTRENRYTLSKSTKDVIRNLNDDLVVEVFLKGDFPSGFRKLANSTEDFLRLLKEYNGARFHYRFISPQDEIGSTGKTYEDSLTNLGAIPINLTVQVKAGQEQKYIYPVALLHYRGQTKLINLYSGSSRIISQIELNSAEALLEYQFLKNLDELTSEEKPVVAFSIGNGEPTGGETYRLRIAIQQRYGFYTYNLKTENSIPDAFNVLLCVKPTQGFTEKDLLKLDQFIMRGGKVILFLDRLYAEEDSLRQKPETIAYDRDLNLTEFLFRFGVRVNPDLIMDLKCDVNPFIVGGTADNPQQECLPWNYYPVFESNSNHLINKGLGLVSGKFVNSIDTLGGNLRKTILLSSSPNSRVISTPAIISLNENKIAPQDEKFRREAIPAAVLVEGKFTSFYRNRVSKTDRDSLAAWNTPFKEESTEDGKLIVVGDGDMALNVFSLDEDPPAPIGMGWNPYTLAAYRNTESGNESLQRCAQAFIPFANENFVMNCLEYFTNKPGIIETGNKDIVLRLLDPAKVKKQKTNWQFINIGIPVILILLFAWIYQQVRKKKYT